MPKTIILGKSKVSLEDILRIARDHARVSINTSALTRCERSFRYLISSGAHKTIYGFNTGFGPMASIKIPDDKRIELQYNLIRSHAVGQGSPLPAEMVRAILAVRLNSLLLGYSGIPRELPQKIAALLNNDILPIIPEHGSVGASGDLVQLAHIALALIGEGSVLYKGKKIKTSDALKRARVAPLTIRSREGLAIMNGTSAMTGIAALNIIKAENLLRQSIEISARLYEITNSYDDALAAKLHAARPHTGQSIIAAEIRKLLHNSKHLRKRYTSGSKENDRVQEVYSIRCAPQILGPIYDAIRYARSVIEIEINSATDNPIISGNKILHGGNFHGDYVAFEMDKLKIAIAKLSLLSERRINFLLNDRINGILPPFLNTGRLGLDLGFQGMQFVATSTAAENQMLSNPMSIHSIPSNRDNQDVVSMGANSALQTYKVISNARIVVKIEELITEKASKILKI